MRWRIKCFKEKLRNKQIVLWGMGALSESVELFLHEEQLKVAFYTSTTSYGGEYKGVDIISFNELNPLVHYVIIATSYYKEIVPLLREKKFEEIEHYYPWYAQVLHKDIIYDGVPIGKNTYGYMAFEKVLGRSRERNFIQSIGRFTSINETAQIERDHRMHMIGQGVLDFMDADVERNYEEKYRQKILRQTYRVKIGNDVWIGANVFINASKVQNIGDGAVIGSNAVVLHDVPPYAIVAGVPAKTIGYRFTPEQIRILLNIKWWDWENEKLKENTELFFDTERFFEKYRNGYELKGMDDEKED